MKAHDPYITNQFKKKSSGDACRAERKARAASITKVASVHANFPGDQKSKLDSLGILLAKVGFSIILITKEGQIIYTNDLANDLLSSRRGLCDMHGRINAVDIEINRKLQRLISTIDYPSRETSSDGSLLLRHQGSRELCVVHIVPIRYGTCSSISSPYCDVIGLLIHHRDHDMVDRAHIFATLFDLTPSEGRVLTELISGKGVACAAKQLNITELTARTHVKHIMEKTDTHRQAELVRLLFQMTIPSDRLSQP